jgi:hypothetical protein
MTPSASTITTTEQASAVPSLRLKGAAVTNGVKNALEGVEYFESTRVIGRQYAEGVQVKEWIEDDAKMKELAKISTSSSLQQVREARL